MKVRGEATVRVIEILRRCGSSVVHLRIEASTECVAGVTSVGDVKEEKKTHFFGRRAGSLKYQRWQAAEGQVVAALISDGRVACVCQSAFFKRRVSATESGILRTETSPTVSKCVSCSDAD